MDRRSFLSQIGGGFGGLALTNLLLVGVVNTGQKT